MATRTQIPVVLPDQNILSDMTNTYPLELCAQSDGSRMTLIVDKDTTVNYPDPASVQFTLLSTEGVEFEGNANTGLYATFADVAFSGYYSDLINKPAIPGAGSRMPETPSEYPTPGTGSNYAREDHVHPLQTNVTGNAGTATILETPRTIALSGAVTGTATLFDGSSNISINTTSIDPAYLSSNIPLEKGGTGVSTLVEGIKQYRGVVFIRGEYPGMDEWVGVTSEISALYDGLVIAFYLPYGNMGVSSSLNLTLSDGTTTGDIPVYLQGSDRIMGQYDGGSILYMTYLTSHIINGTTYDTPIWYCQAQYWENDRVYMYNTKYSDENYPILFGYSTVGQIISYQKSYSRFTDKIYASPFTGMITAGGLTVSTTGNVKGIAVQYTATLSTTWTGSAAPYYQDLTISGLTEEDTGLWLDVNFTGTYETDKAYDEAWSGGVYRATVTAADTLRVYSHTAIEVAIPIRLIVVR